MTRREGVIVEICGNDCDCIVDGNDCVYKESNAESNACFSTLFTLLQPPPAAPVPSWKVQTADLALMFEPEVGILLTMMLTS